MVVLHNEELHRTLWGPASTPGRSRATDAGMRIQLILLALLGIGSALYYEKPQAVRLAVAAVSSLVYFRSTALFVRLMLFVSCVVLYGDLVMPIRRLVGDGELPPLSTARLALHCIWLWNNCRILYAILRSGALKTRGRRKRPAVAASTKHSKFA